MTTKHARLSLLDLSTRQQEKKRREHDSSTLLTSVYVYCATPTAHAWTAYVIR